MCSGSVLLGDLLGVSRSTESDLLSVLLIYPRFFCAYLLCIVAFFVFVLFCYNLIHQPPPVSDMTYTVLSGTLNSIITQAEIITYMYEHINITAKSNIVSRYLLCQDDRWPRCVIAKHINFPGQAVYITALNFRCWDEIYCIIMINRDEAALFVIESRNRHNRHFCLFSACNGQY